MRKLLAIFMVATTVGICAATNKNDSGNAVHIPPSPQRNGDATKGYEYLTTGDFIKSGLPYDFVVTVRGKGKNYLNRTGKNANVDHGYNVVKNADGMDIVIPTCLQCHAEVLDNKLYVGLGNSLMDFSAIRKDGKKVSMLKMWQTTAPAKYRAAKSLIRSITTVDPFLETEVEGVNAADRLAAILVAHRDPKTLAWSDTAMLDIPDAVVPTDVPAWWLLKKKNAMFYNGFGRGDFSKFLMLSNILTVSDSSEAREVDSHFGDVLAYIRSLQPPHYPRAIDERLAAKGREVFNENCRRCHGTYGDNGQYPNLLIPGAIVGTDSLLFRANQQAKPFLNWFNNSWFVQGNDPAQLVPFNGYIAPPLDGVWITAPYLHNGSVPTIEAVLNSKLRPMYWSRDLDEPVYDYDKLGWKYTREDKGGSKHIYNTTLPGYGNYGHTFGDHLSDRERTAVIEYLKTL
jgi:Cytochrome c